MARIRPLTKEQAPPELHRHFEAGERWLGQPPISTGIQAYAPPILEVDALWYNDRDAARAKIPT